MKNSYAVRMQSVEISGHIFTVAVIDDPDALVDSITVEEYAEDERLPFWAELWPSSVSLSLFLFTSGICRGKRVLELGTGLGLNSICAASDCASLTITDYEQDALLFAMYNIHLNAQASDLAKVSVREFDWRDPSESLGLFDVILGSDILYERSVFDQLIRVCTSHLLPGGTIVLSDPCRTAANDFIMGVDQEKKFEVESMSYHREGLPSTVMVHILRNRANAGAH